MSKPTLIEIRSAANILFGEDVGVKTRKRDLLRKRQITHYVSNVVFGHSLSATGAEIGCKNHATVINSCKVISNEIPHYDYIKTWVRKLTNMCRSKEKPNTVNALVFDLLKSKTLDPNVKVELRRILKLLKNEDYQK